MRTRARLFGAGTDADPYRVAWPNATIVAVSYARRLAVIDVPDEDLPPDTRVRDYLRLAIDLADPDPAPMPALLRAYWHDYLDDRYRERRGLFRPLPA